MEDAASPAPKALDGLVQRVQRVLVERHGRLDAGRRVGAVERQRRRRKAHDEKSDEPTSLKHSRAPHSIRRPEIRAR